MSRFADRLADAIDRARTPACVGLDPVLERLPSVVRREHDDPSVAIAKFCTGVLRACAGIVPVVKLQSACFERHGEHGVRVLRHLIIDARALGYVVILDAKRGDIGISAEHYAASAFAGSAPADALTVAPYMGPDTIEPFLAYASSAAPHAASASTTAAGAPYADRPDAGRGVFVLVRTSNPGSDAVQSLRLSDGRSVSEMVADMVAQLGRSRVGRRGLSDVGAVVGATKPQDGAALRARMPDQVFLVPGFGAQGGTPDDVRAMLRPTRTSPGDAGVLVTASRSIIYAFKPDDADWEHAIADAAQAFVGELRKVIEPA
jgi:orotidine-5'-phosphate decarboxylase